jgi:hypothetical protein
MLQLEQATAGRAAPRFLSKKGYAEHRGCSPAYVSKLIRLGKLAAPALTRDGMVDVALADAQLAGQADPARQAVAEPLPLEPELPEASGPAAATFAASKARREAAAADLAEIELAKKRGELVDRVSVHDAGFDVGALLRDRLATRRSELASLLATITDVDDAIARLEAADRKLCEDLAEDARRRLERIGG